MDISAMDQSDRKYNVCLQGASLDVGNLGCCALAASFIRLVVNTKPNAEINLLYANRTGGVQNLEVSAKTVEANIVNFRLSPKARIGEHLFWILFLAILQRVVPIKFLRNKIVQSNRYLRTLENADFVGEIRGGDSFSDIYGLRRFLLGIIPCIIAILMRKQLVLLPQTYGPFKSRIAKSVARYIILRAHQIFSRDHDSIDLVQELFGKNTKNKTIEFCPDVAFVLESRLPKKPEIKPPLNPDNKHPLIGLNISGLLYVGGFTRNNMFGLTVDYKCFVHLLLEELMNQTDAEVLLVPHVFWGGVEGDELRICHDVFKSMSEKYSTRIHIVDHQYDQNSIKGIIGQCDFFVGSRMHACIAAVSQCIPAVGLAYSKKFLGVFRSVDVGELAIDMRQKKQEEIIKAVIAAFENRHAISGNLKLVIPGIQKQVRNVFKEMICKSNA